MQGESEGGAYRAEQSELAADRLLPPAVCCSAMYFVPHWEQRCWDTRCRNGTGAGSYVFYVLTFGKLKGRRRTKKDAADEEK